MTSERKGATHLQAIDATTGVPINRSCLNQTTNSRTISGATPRFTIPDPDIGPDGDLTEVRALDIATGREVWRYSQRAPNAGSTLATAGNVVFFGDSNRRFRAFDAETARCSGRRSWAARSAATR